MFLTNRQTVDMFVDSILRTGSNQWTSSCIRMISGQDIRWQETTHWEAYGPSTENPEEYERYIWILLEKE